jgi:hypothetical protein
MIPKTILATPLIGGRSSGRLLAVSEQLTHAVGLAGQACCGFFVLLLNRPGEFG